jgi:hypothetical protein
LGLDNLIFWKVDLPVDETIEHNLNNLTLDTKKSLSPVTKLQKVFSKIPEDEHLHIVIEGPPAGELSFDIDTLSSLLIAV